jgi:hemimethylated DNA binding protein
MPSARRSLMEIRFSPAPRNGVNLSPKTSGPTRISLYHLLAENAETEYVAYVSEQNLVADPSGEPIYYPLMRAGNSAYQIRPARLN